MEQVYRGYRIAVTEHEGWVARIFHVRGPRAPMSARASQREGPELCLSRARGAIDDYLRFLGDRPESEPGR